MNSGRPDSRAATRFVPRVEALEDRTVPAGNVQVTVGDGILYVAGDNEANRIWIAGAGERSVVIRSLDGTTTINGRSNPLFVGGIKRGYYARMNGGDDFLLVTGTRSNGLLDADTGDGNDNLHVGDAGHRKETVLGTGAGNDVVILNGSSFRRPVYVNTGAGDDQLIANQIRAKDFWATNPLGVDFFDNRGSAFDFAKITGFANGMRPASPPAMPPPPPADMTRPTPTLTTTATDPTRTSPIPFSVNFDEDVTGFDADDLVVTNGVVTAFTQLDARTYTFEVTPATQGIVTAMVAPAFASDLAGNANVASVTVSRNFDTVAPTLTINGQTTSNRTPTVSGTVNDSNAAVQVTVNGVTRTATVIGNAWSVFIATPLPDNVYVVAATATDPAGNVGTSTLLAGLIVDLTAPTGTIAATGTGSISGTCGDATAGIQSVEVSVRNAGGMFFTGPNTGFSSSTEVFLLVAAADSVGWVLPLATPGTYTVNARITDKAGNVTNLMQSVVVS